MNIRSKQKPQATNAAMLLQQPFSKVVAHHYAAMPNQENSWDLMIQAFCLKVLVAMRLAHPWLLRRVRSLGAPYGGSCSSQKHMLFNKIFRKDAPDF